MTLHLIDTSAWIAALRGGAGNSAAAEAVRKLLDDDLVAICPIIMLELLQGTVSKGNYQELFSELGALHHIEITSEVWASSYLLGFELRRKGATVPATDILIAAATIENKLTLVHRDKHFDIIARHSSLRTTKI